VGAASHFAFHALINIGMTLGLLPVTGIPLPFMSYGGSALIINMITVGMMVGMGMRWREY
jgi:rod shape determining protein RodA